MTFLFVRFRPYRETGRKNHDRAVTFERDISTPARDFLYAFLA